MKQDVLSKILALHFCGANLSYFRDVVTQHIFNAHLKRSC